MHNLQSKITDYLNYCQTQKRLDTKTLKAYRIDLGRRFFTSSNPTIVRLLRPPTCGPFSIQESTVGGLSYKVKNSQGT